MTSHFPERVLVWQQSGARFGFWRVRAVCIDISGFTTLTETLMTKGRVGAEEISAALNNLFQPLVALVYARGGWIPYFAGDAFTALFDEDTISAEDLLTLSFQIRDLVLADADRRFDVKIGLGGGDAEWGLVGSPLQTFYVRGAAIDSTAEAQLWAKKGQIVISPELYSEINHIPLQYTLLPNGFYRVAGLRPPRPTGLLLQPFEHQGEFRQVTACFLAFDGMADHAAMDHLASLVWQACQQYGGYFKEIDFGDKGGLIVCFFGAPVSYEDSVYRALDCVLDIRQQLEQWRLQDSAIQYKCGVTTGVAFTGIVGGAQRYQYAAVGKRVNLAARLMQKAAWSQILTDDNTAQTKAFVFVHEGSVNYKGVLHNVPTWRLEGKHVEEHHLYQGVMAGRAVELARLVALADRAAHNRLGTGVMVIGEGGIGKSRLTYELEQTLQGRYPQHWLNCPCDKVLPRPFLCFAVALRQIMGVVLDRPQVDNNRAFETALELLNQSLHVSDQADPLNVYRPALRYLCGLEVDDPAWEMLDGKIRYEICIEAVVFVIQTLAQDRFVIVEIEDAAWIDNASLDVLQKLVQETAQTALLIVANVRLTDTGLLPNHVEDSVLGTFERIQLEPLNISELTTLAVDRLSGPTAPQLVKALQSASNGNPFFAEQLLAYWVEQEAVVFDNKTWRTTDKHLGLSDSIQTVLTARLDRLSDLVRDTIKTAAVIGREFDTPVLARVMALQNGIDDTSYTEDADKQVEDNVHDAEKAQIVRALSDIRYIFQQALLHEAVYDMQLRSRLKDIHRDTARAIELVYADKLDNHYDELAYHYAKADAYELAANYMMLAAHQARRAYQNEHAINLYNRLLNTLLPPDDPQRLIALVYLGDVYELLGRWDEAATCYEEALRLKTAQLDVKFLNRARSERGYIALLQSDYDQARLYLNEAVALMEQSDDVFGRFKVHAHLGLLHFRLGLYEQAQSYFERSLHIGADYAHTATAAEAAAYLGLTHMNLGRYEQALETMSHQLTFCRKAGNRHGIAALQTNLGIVYTDLGYEDQAMACFEEGLALAKLLGDKRLSSINLGCLGIVHQQRSEFDRAFQLFDEDLRLCQEMGDTQGIAICYGLLGVLYAQQGLLVEAIKFQKKALKGCKEIGYLKGVAKARCEIAATFVLSNKPDKAILQYNKAISICRELGQRPLLMQCLIEKSISLLELEVFFELPDLLAEARAIYDASYRPAMRFPLMWAEAWWQSASCRDASFLKQIDTGSLSEKADVAWAVWCTEPNQEHLRQLIEATEVALASRPAFRLKRRLDMIESLHKK